MDIFDNIEVVDFLLASDFDFDFEHVLLSYAEESAIYLTRDFQPFLSNVHWFRYALFRAKERVKHRLHLGQFVPTSADVMSFSRVLIDTFQDKTLYDILLVDYFSDFNTDFHNAMCDYSAGFDAVQVYTAYQNVKKLCLQLHSVRDQLVINIFATECESEGDSEYDYVCDSD